VVADDDGTATFEYTVTATPTGSTDTGWLMSGRITVENPNRWQSVTVDVTDMVDIGGGASCEVAGGSGVEVPAATRVGESTVPGRLTLDYDCTFTSQPAYDGTNTATVTWDADEHATPGGTATGTAAIVDAEWDTTPVNSTVTVMDDRTDPDNPVELGQATWNPEGTPTRFTYTVTKTGVPAGECVDYTNTAWIEETSQQASAEVTACRYAGVLVSKTVEAEYDRTY